MKTESPSPKLPYRTPILQVFGPVSTVTATMSMGGTLMDGGPNNSKS